MKALWLVPILASILLLGVFAYSPISFADDDDDDDDDFDDNPCLRNEVDDDDSIRVGIHRTIAHVLDDDDDDDREARDDDDDDDDDEPCLPANTPPTIESVTLTQDAFGDVTGAFGSASRPTVCDANGVMDADGDLVTLSFEWLREDGTLITTGSTLPIASVVNELVTCKVTPFDGTDFGASASSSVALSTLGA